jgi:MFS family permease
MHPLALDGNWRVVAGVLLGIVFGFLLVKSRDAWRKTLIDQLFLKNTYFIKMFLVSVSVGSVLFFFFEKWGLVNPQFRPVYFWGAAIGGLLTAIGLALCGQVPVSTVASLASGRLYAIWVLAGMLLAVPVVRVVSDNLSDTLSKWSAPVDGETLQAVFSSDQTCFWVAGISIMIALFLEFIRTDSEETEKK